MVVQVRRQCFAQLLMAAPSVPYLGRYWGPSARLLTPTSPNSLESGKPMSSLKGCKGRIVHARARARPRARVCAPAAWWDQPPSGTIFKLSAV